MNNIREPKKSPIDIFKKTIDYSKKKRIERKIEKSTGLKIDISVDNNNGKKY